MSERRKEPLTKPDQYLEERYPCLTLELKESYESEADFGEAAMCFQELAHERAMRISADNEVLKLLGQSRAPLQQETDKDGERYRGIRQVAVESAIALMQYDGNGKPPVPTWHMLDATTYEQFDLEVDRVIPIAALPQKDGMK